MECKEICARHAALVSQRKTVEDIWQIINYFVMPFRGDFFNFVTSEHTIQWRENRRIFDSTAPNACSMLASALHGSLTSPAIRWFEIEYGDPRLAQDQQAQEWLEAASSLMFRSLQESNFNLEANEVYLDMVGYGNAFLVHEEEEDNQGNFDKMVFQSTPLEESWFEEDYRGRIYNFYRRYKWTAVQIVSKFGEANVPDKIKQQYNSTNVDEKHDVIFCIYTRKDKANNDGAHQKLAATERAYGYKWVMPDCGQFQLGDEGGYYEMPVYAPRWRKTNKSKWGHGPTTLALPDILTLNQLVELILKSAEKAVDPSSLIQERALMSDIDLGPGGKTILRDLDGIKAYESGARFDVSELQRDRLRDGIEKTYFIDQLHLKESPSMTATEVQTRYELMQRLLGPTLGRLQSDYLDPLIERTFNILFRAGEFGAPPQSILEGTGGLDIVYTGPLVRAQRADIAQGVTRWIAGLAELSAVRPDVLDVPDWDMVARELGSLEGVPAKLMKSIEDIQEERDERKEMETQAQMAELHKMEGEGAQAVAEGAQAIRAVGGE